MERHTSSDGIGIRTNDPPKSSGVPGPVRIAVLRSRAEPHFFQEGGFGGLKSIPRRSSVRWWRGFRRVGIAPGPWSGCHAGAWRPAEQGSARKRILDTPNSTPKSDTADAHSRCSIELSKREGATSAPWALSTDPIPRAPFGDAPPHRTAATLVSHCCS